MALDKDLEGGGATDSALDIRGLGKAFAGVPVLQDMNLAVAPGELIAVLGASGSGKTTLLRLVCGFERADHGSVHLAARPIADAGRGLHLAPERRGVGYVAQEGALFPHLNVQDNILFGLPRRERRGSSRARGQRVARLLELMGLPAQYAMRKPAALSGGEQQRVALARALAPGPTIVLLDEPFSALDAGLRADTRAAVASSLQQVGATALLVTHDQDEALSMGHRVAVLQRGRLVQVATPRMLYRHPVNPEVAHFVGDAAVVPGVVNDNRVECCFGQLPLASTVATAGGRSAAPQAVDVLIRPEQFQLRLSTAGDTAPGFRAAVKRVDFYGHDARVDLVTEVGLEFVAAVTGIELPEVGQSVTVQVRGAVVSYPRSAGEQRETAV